MNDASFSFCSLRLVFPLIPFIVSVPLSLGFWRKGWTRCLTFHESTLKLAIMSIITSNFKPPLLKYGKLFFLFLNLLFALQ
jgi:hypothetical protein